MEVCFLLLQSVTKQYDDNYDKVTMVLLKRILHMNF